MTNNVETARFEFSRDRICEKSPCELGQYIAGMAGTEHQLETLAGFVDALLNYDKTFGQEFQRAFIEARAKIAYQHLEL